MNLRVLIVDDSPAMRTFMRRVLVLSGVEGLCLEASNGFEALKIVRDSPVDLIFTDINMPVMNGEQLLASLSADENLRAIPVIVVSTDSTDTLRARMMSLGAYSYVRKPFTPEILRAEIDAVRSSVHV